MIYYDQTITVESVPNEPSSPIRVKFRDVTLALSEVDASWLAENIHRELRNMHNDRIASATPLTVEQRRALKPGDRVVVRMDHGHPIGDMTYDVKRSPWQLGHGTWVIGLDGISGGYNLDRVIGQIQPKGKS